MARMTTAVPTRKVMASSLGAAAATVLIYAIESMTGAALPDSVTGALGVILVFLFGYYAPSAPRDTISATDRADPLAP